MRKSKVLSVAVSAVLVASLAAATSISASAIAKSSEIPGHQVGVAGSFNGWDNDVILSDADGDGVYEGTVEVAKVTEDMIVGWNVDDEPTGESYLQFKVRLDGNWDDSWGNYEPLNDRTWNSQSNVPVKEAKVGEPLKFTVYFDIKHPSPAALANPGSYVEGENDDSYDYLNVYYKIEEVVDSSSKEPVSTTGNDTASTQTSAVSAADDTTSTQTSTVAVEDKTDSTAPATGDATSAAALAAVVVASLGIAVVMTKKASAK